LTPSAVASAVLLGLAQVSFTSSRIAGGLVLAAIACISPWGAVAAMVGAIIGTIAGWLLDAYSEPLWSAGLSGYNAAIVGIMWGGLLASGIPDLPFLLVAFIMCILLEELLRRLLGYADLPMLSLPAVLTAYTIAAIYTYRGDTFWINLLDLPFGTPGITISIACVVAALATVSIRATIQTVVVSALLTIVANQIFDRDIAELWSLWAFAVAPANFGVQAIFLTDRTIGSVGGLFASLVSFALWAAWISSGLMKLMPPLMMPFIIATWMTIILFRKLGRERVV
jgi:urea transporter